VVNICRIWRASTTSGASVKAVFDGRGQDARDDCAWHLGTAYDWTGRLAGIAAAAELIKAKSF
jgi:hypothetical protein